MISWILLFLELLHPSRALAQDDVLSTWCEGKEGQATSLKLIPLNQSHDLILIDQGFCKLYQDSLSLPSPPGGWKIRFYASHSFTRYFDSNIQFQSSRYQVEIKDYEWAERGSREFFKPSKWFKAGGNPARLLDEPSNTYTISIEKEGHEFYLSAFHPKFLQAPNQMKHMTGTIDGASIDRVQAVNEPFHGYTLTPGESKLVRNEFTHSQMLYEIGYGYRFRLLASRAGTITYIPHIGIGFQMGRGYSAMVRAGQWWDTEDSTESPHIQGFAGSISNRIEVNSRGEGIGIFYENRLGYSRMQNKFFDGSERFSLGFVGNSIGVKFILHHNRLHHTHPQPINAASD